jgi:uncharacterized membrane protein
MLVHICAHILRGLLSYYYYFNTYISIAIIIIIIYYYYYYYCRCYFYFNQSNFTLVLQNRVKNYK